MKNTAYKLSFTSRRPEDSPEEIRQFTRIVLAEDEGDAFLEATRIKNENSDVDCKFTGFEKVKTGKVWKVTMDGSAHLRNGEGKLVEREDMHKVIFVDAFDMYDAEQIAYRIWERQVVEEGWDDIMIFRTLIDVSKLPMVDKFEGGKNVA